MQLVIGKWGETVVQRGYYINTVELRGHTPSNCSQQLESLSTFLRHGALSPYNVPEKQTNMLGMGCGRSASTTQ